MIFHDRWLWLCPLLLSAACVVAVPMGAEPQRLTGASPHRSRCAPACFENGSCNEELGRCDCIRGKKGADCSLDLTPEELHIVCKELLFHGLRDCLRAAQPCLNDCNNKGKCHFGVCKCPAGVWGADCSLTWGADGRAALLPEQGYTLRRRRPYVYVYELPPQYFSWASTKRMDRPLHIMFWQRLLSSGARTADPDEADWLFIPLRLRSKRDSYMYLEAIQYINTTWPYLSKLQGKRHIAFHTGDMGVDEMITAARTAVPGITWLTHWGLHTDSVLPAWRAAHRPDQDVVVPVYVSPHNFDAFKMDRSPLHPKYKDWASRLKRSKTLFFAGRICGDRSAPREDGVWPNCGPDGLGYSAGVRQRVHFHHNNRTGFKVVARVKSYGIQLQRSTFCLAPPGGGHGQRQVLVSFMGCVPVTIGDGIYQPFEPQLNWSRFSVQPLESQIPSLHTLLESVPVNQVAAMQQALRCAAQHFVWSSVTGGFMGETGQYDAYETILQILWAKQRYPEADPAQYAGLDHDFSVFMTCGSETWGGPVNTTWITSQGLASAQAALVHNPLCSHSRFDGREPPCYRCMRGRSNTHGVPGGHMCCGSTDQLGKCPRVWD